MPPTRAGAWDRCLADANQACFTNQFIGPWDALNAGTARMLFNGSRCPDVVASVRAATWAAAESLSAELTADLEDVWSIVQTLQGIVRAGGMPQVRLRPPACVAGRGAAARHAAGYVALAVQPARATVVSTPPPCPMQASFGVLRTSFPLYSGACNGKPAGGGGDGSGNGGAGGGGTWPPTVWVRPCGEPHGAGLPAPVVTTRECHQAQRHTTRACCLRRPR